MKSRLNRPCCFLVLAVFLLTIVLYAKNHMIGDVLIEQPKKTWGLAVGLGVVGFGLIAARISYSQKRRGV